MITLPLPSQRAYIARMARDTGATLITYGRTRAEARKRAIALLEPEFGRQYAHNESKSATRSHP